MVTNTEVSAQDKAEDGKDLYTRDPRDGEGIKPGPPMYNKFTGFINILLQVVIYRPCRNMI